jgi:hypothetical protein
MMRIIYRLLALAGLALVLIPSFLHYLDKLDKGQMTDYIFVGTLIWFAGAIPWLGRKKKESSPG